MVVQKPYQTNLLIAGFDEGAGPSLYWMDYLATMHSMNIAGTGYGNARFGSQLPLPFHEDQDFHPYWTVCGAP